MIRGIVNALHEAVVPIRLRGPNGIELDIDAIVDTGFDDQLILPKSRIAARRLAGFWVGLASRRAWME